jgi:hypothetical protein
MSPFLLEKSMAYPSTSAAQDAVAVTTSDATIIPVTRALYIGTGGNLKVRMASGNTVTFTSVAAGVFPIQVDMVYSTDTTASGIFALY